MNKTDVVPTCTHLTYMDMNQIITGMINQKRKLVWLGGGVGNRKEFQGKEMSCEVRAYSRKKKNH